MAKTFDDIRPRSLVTFLIPNGIGRNGQEWKELGNGGPTKRGVYSLVYDRVRHEALFYGSGILEDGIWILDSETWKWQNNDWHLVR